MMAQRGFQADCSGAVWKAHCSDKVEQHMLLGSRGQRRVQQWL